MALAVGVVESGWALLAVPAAVFIGLAFSAVGMFATTFMRSWVDFDWVMLVIQPLFLLSATFFPLGTYPGWVQPIVMATPLYTESRGASKRYCAPDEACRRADTSLEHVFG